MIRITIITILSSIFLNGCFDGIAKSDITKTFRDGNIDINYYSEKTVTSLEVPPDLTTPDYQKAFRLKEYVDDIPESVISFSDKDKQQDKAKVLRVISDIQVKKDGNIRYLIVDKSPELIWDLSSDFLRLQGFSIEKSNKKIGIMETNFLENRPELPSETVGMIRSMFQKALSARYTLPIIDKYRIRIEPYEENTKSRVYLTHTAMREVYINSGTDNETTMWEATDKNFELETEMLYRLMYYLGGEEAKAREEIINVTDSINLKINLVGNKNEYPKLIFEESFLKAWDHFNWALDKLNLDIEDKDIIEKTIHIRGVESSKEGIFSKLFGDDAIKETYRFAFKQLGPNKTEVIYLDLAEKNSDNSIAYSHQLFTKIKDQFN